MYTEPGLIPPSACDFREYRVPSMTMSSPVVLPGLRVAILPTASQAYLRTYSNDFLLSFYALGKAVCAEIEARFGSRLYATKRWAKMRADRKRQLRTAKKALDGN
jgi:hypothetical protein